MYRMKMNKKQFLASLSDVYVRLGHGKHGVGVLAIRPIPKGTNPFKNCDPFGSVLKIPEGELAQSAAPEAVKTLVRDFCALQDGVYYVPDYGIDALDKSYYLNHSKKPNLTTTDHGETFVALRNIKKGEELSVSYDLFNETEHFVRK
jgi:SET domain-containing protein